MVKCRLKWFFTNIKWLYHVKKWFFCKYNGFLTLKNGFFISCHLIFVRCNVDIHAKKSKNPVFRKVLYFLFKNTIYSNFWVLLFTKLAQLMNWLLLGMRHYSDTKMKWWWTFVVFFQLKYSLVWNVFRSLFLHFYCFLLDKDDHYREKFSVSLPNQLPSSNKTQPKKYPSNLTRAFNLSIKID